MGNFRVLDANGNIKEITTIVSTLIGPSGESLPDPNYARVFWAHATPGTGTPIGMGHTVAARGTTPAALTSETDIGRVGLTTGSASADVSELYASATGLVQPQLGCTAIFYVKTATDITKVLFWVGLATTPNLDFNANTITASTPIAAFRFSTEVPDAGWVGYTQPTGASAPTSTTSSIASVTANTIYKLKIRIPVGGGAFYFSVNDGTESSIATANVPAATANLSWFASCATAENVAKTLKWAKTYIVAA